MLILSVNLSHDGAAVLLRDGRLAGYVNTERFSRIKKHPGVREAELRELLRQAGAELDAVDHVILGGVGMNYPELVERYGRDFQDTWPPFTIDQPRGRVSLLGRELPCTVNPDHFLCHAAVAYYFSPFQSAACFACDPMGSGAFIGEGNRLRRIPLAETHIGAVYNVISADHLKFGGLFGAGKTMGLAPYGHSGDLPSQRRLEALCRAELPPERVGDVVAAIARIGQAHPSWVGEGSARWNATLALALQEALEHSLGASLAQLHRAAQQFGAASAQLCLSGGTALNSVANQRCFARSSFGRLYLHPACGDDGTAIGAALHHWHDVLGNPKLPRTDREAMYSVRSYSAAEVDGALSAAPQLQVRRTEACVEETAELLAGGGIVGWFDGASEIGPRALGHRSILANPTLPGMKDTLNAQVKHREAFRPFAPSVLDTEAQRWFGLSGSPFMLRVAPVLQQGVPAITHHDGTARIQTVRPEDDPRYCALLRAFHQRTGVPMLLNTSFNIRAEPIVETPGDAVRTFLESGMDALVFPGVIARRRPG